MRRTYEAEAYGQMPVQNCYWHETAKLRSHAPLAGEQSCDIAIIGAGFTGLSAALTLAEAGEDVVVLDAEQPGWGASGRNGGFCCLGGAKATHGGISRRFGTDDANAWAHTERAAVDLVAELLENHAIEADTHSKGETLLAHSSRALAGLRAEKTRVHAVYGLEATLLQGNELAEHGLAADTGLKGRANTCIGALTTQLGFALNPLKYVLGLARSAAGRGAKIHGQSQVLAHAENADGSHSLRTNAGTLRARRVIFATNGYSADDLPHAFRARYLPIQSNILVSRVLTTDELNAQGWTSRQMCYDTRHLLHYFRLLPDNRMLFGMRGATSASPRAFAAARTAARRDFDAMFPAWRAVETPWFWSGLLAGARHMVPFAGAIPGMKNAWSAMCYHGNGVAMGTWAGQRIARLALGQPADGPAFLNAPPARFPFGRYRRAVLPFVYRWYQIQDRF